MIVRCAATDALGYGGAAADEPAGAGRDGSAVVGALRRIGAGCAA